MSIKSIAIVGGGTAGWMAANHLGVELGRDPSVEITLIESKDIPVIGVGEGTVPRIKETLKKFGIAEAELLATCDVTFKQAIKFSNWMSSEKQGLDNSYYHPFGAPYPMGYNVNSFWLQNRDYIPYSQLADIYHASEMCRSPKKLSSPPYVGAVDYAYHFNAEKFSKLLAENACRRFGVRHKFETVHQVKLDEEGFIESLVYSSGKSESFDFFIDCSGFSSRLMNELSVGFVDKSDQILTDSVLVKQVATSQEIEIPPYTLATAHEAGWIWDIPLLKRRGTGFVYSSRHMSDEDAALSFSRYLGADFKLDDYRKIKMKIGYRECFWRKNCAALGLAQGFVEPLEATSILVTDFSAQLLASNFPRERDEITLFSEYCNSAVTYTWERVIDFVQLHYYVSDRRDSEFWRECTSNEVMSDTLRNRLDRWSLSPPKASDFESSFDLFGVENYLFVIYGMDFNTREPVMSPQEQKHSEFVIEQLKLKSKSLANQLMSHRQWLGRLHKETATQYDK